MGKANFVEMNFKSKMIILKRKSPPQVYVMGLAKRKQKE